MKGSTARQIQTEVEAHLDQRDRRVLGIVNDLTRKLTASERECMRLGRENSVQCDEIDDLKRRLRAAEEAVMELQAMVQRAHA